MGEILPAISYYSSPYINSKLMLIKKIVNSFISIIFFIKLITLLSVVRV